jgi:predicted PurR-regulated permease PerM
MTSPATTVPAAVRRSRQAWQALGHALQSITPRELMRLVLIGGAIYAVAWLGTATWPALAPFVAGAVAAYILLPIVNRLDRHMPRGLAVALAVSSLAALVGGFLALLVPALVDQATRLVVLMPSSEQVRALSQQATDFKGTLPPVVQTLVNESVTQVSTSIRANLLGYWSRLVTVAIGGSISLLSTLGFVLGFLVVPGWLLSVLREQRNGISAFQRLLPVRMRPDVWAALTIIDRAFSTFIRAQVVLAIAVGLLTYVSLRLFDVLGFEQPGNRLLLATLNGTLTLVPQIGPVLALVLAALVGLTQSPEMALAMVLLFLGVNAVVGNLIAPRLERRVTDIHPTILVIAIVALSGLGLVWVLLAAPIAAVARDLFRYTFGRLSDPPRPAGLLPGATLPAVEPVPTRPRRGWVARRRRVRRASTWSVEAVRLRDG